MSVLLLAIGTVVVILVLAVIASLRSEEEKDAENSQSD
jgi:hypothetical protein